MEISTSRSPSLIVSTADNADALNLVLDSIRRQSFAPRDVLVVDESTDEQAAAVVENWEDELDFPVTRFTSAKPGSSRSPSLNRAVRAATGDYLIFIDGDCLLHRHFIADHLRHAAPGALVQGRRAGVRARYVRRISSGKFHPILWFLWRRAYGIPQGLRRPWPHIRINDFRRIHGCNFAVSLSDLIRVNGFNESFNETGDEFVELAVRLANAGLTLQTITGQAVVYHLDHRHTARYRSLSSARILEQTRQDRIARCAQGIIPRASSSTGEPVVKSEHTQPDPTPATTADSIGRTETPATLAKQPSHFRDEIVPRSMLAPVVPPSH